MERALIVSHGWFVSIFPPKFKFVMEFSRGDGIKRHRRISVQEFMMSRTIDLSLERVKKIFIAFGIIKQIMKFAILRYFKVIYSGNRLLYL